MPSIGLVEAPLDRRNNPIDLSDIAKLLADVIDQFRPHQIWLFGDSRKQAWWN